MNCYQLLETLNEKYFNVRFYSLLHSDTYKLTRLIWSYFEKKGHKIDRQEKQSSVISGRKKSDIRDYERGVTFDIENISIRLDLEEKGSLRVKIVDYDSKNITINFIQIGDKTVIEVLDKIYELMQMTIKGEDLKKTDLLSNIENFANKKLMKINSGKLTSTGESKVIIISIDYRNILKIKELSDLIFNSRMNINFASSEELIKDLKSLISFTSKKIINNGFKIEKIRLVSNQVDIIYKKTTSEKLDIDSEIKNVIDEIKNKKRNHETFKDNKEMISYGKRIVIRDIFNGNKEVMHTLKG